MLLSSPLLILLLDPAFANRGESAHFFTDRFATGHIVRGRAAHYRNNRHNTTTRIDIVPDGLLLTVPSDVTTVTAEVSSEAGEEEVELTELDAWLHGAVDLPTLRGDTGTVELVLLDSNSMELKRFTGRLTRTAREYSWTGFSPVSAHSGGDCNSRVGCTAEVEEVDVDVIGGDLRGLGISLSIDLVGADLYNVAYASVTVSEELATCVGVYDRSNTCTEWSYLSLEETVEVGFDAIGAVWGADLRLRHVGEAISVANLYKTESNERYRLRSSMRAPWLDGGAGISVQSIDEDPLTGVGFTTRDGVTALTVFSEGWTTGSALPVDAEVELSTGEIFVIPVESYQRKAARNAPTSSEANELFDMVDPAGFRLNIGGRPVRVYDQLRWSEGAISSRGSSSEETARDVLTLADFEGGPLCVEGTCVNFVANTEGGYDLTATQYRWNTGFEGGFIGAEITMLDSTGAVVWEEEHSLSFEEEITAVFSTDLSIDGDVVNLALAGNVRLRGEPNRGGQQPMLAKGRFYSVITRDGDGDLDLGATAKNLLSAAAETNFAILLGGMSSSCGDDEGGYNGTWPRLVATSGWGSGTAHQGVATCRKIALACRD